MQNIKLGSENLIFKEIASESTQTTLAYGLFRDDGIHLGKSICISNKYDGQAWYLDNIFIFPKFERRGYGSQLLEATCQALWLIKQIDIVLERPGDTVASDGFNRQEWYERHGFKSSPALLTWMIRPYQ